MTGFTIDTTTTLFFNSNQTMLHRQVLNEGMYASWSPLSIWVPEPCNVAVNSVAMPLYDTVLVQTGDPEGAAVGDVREYVTNGKKEHRVWTGSIWLLLNWHPSNNVPGVIRRKADMT